MEVTTNWINLTQLSWYGDSPDKMNACLHEWTDIIADIFDKQVAAHELEITEATFADLLARSGRPGPCIKEYRLTAFEPNNRSYEAPVKIVEDEVEPHSQEERRKNRDKRGGRTEAAPFEIEGKDKSKNEKTNANATAKPTPKADAKTFATKPKK